VVVSRISSSQWSNDFSFVDDLHFAVSVLGCYISKCVYYRNGEKGLDNFYRPVHRVEYYRYVRFFPEGL
jgi:hypothetical protein